MKRIEKIREARVRMEGDEIEATLYDYDEYSYNDDGIEYIEIDKIKGTFIEFPMGCFNISISTHIGEIDHLMWLIEEAEKEIEELKSSKWSQLPTTSTCGGS